MWGRKSRWVASWLAVVVLSIAPAACSNGAKKGGGNGPNTTSDASSAINAKCAALRDHVASLYSKAQPPDKDPKKQKRRESVIADNVNMVLTDCAKHPAKAAPCIKAATSVATIEADCVIKLDDEGEVEGNYFKNNP